MVIDRSVQIEVAPVPAESRLGPGKGHLRSGLSDLQPYQAPGIYPYFLNAFGEINSRGKLGRERHEAGVGEAPVERVTRHRRIAQPVEP